MKCLSLVSIVAIVLGVPAAFAEGQKIEVREGDTWSPATILKKEGRHYLTKTRDAGACGQSSMR